MGLIGAIALMASLTPASNASAADALDPTDNTSAGATSEELVLFTAGTIELSGGWSPDPSPANGTYTSDIANYYLHSDAVTTLARGQTTADFTYTQSNCCIMNLSARGEINIVGRTCDFDAGTDGGGFWMYIECPDGLIGSGRGEFVVDHINSTDHHGTGTLAMLITLSDRS